MGDMVDLVNDDSCPNDSRPDYERESDVRLHGAPDDCHPCMSRLLRHGIPLGLTIHELLFVVNLLDDHGGVPTQQVLADRMGVTVRCIRRYTRSLEEKRFLTFEPGTGFDLNGLLTVLSRLEAS